MRTDLSSLAALPAFDDDGRLLAVIEAARGSRQKFKHRPEWNVFVLSRVLPAGLAYPYDFGFIPSTLGDDGDPLDVLVLADEPVPPGSVVPCRILGVIEAEQPDEGGQAKRNDRILAAAVSARSARGSRALRDLPKRVPDEIEQFFIAYNAERGGRFRPLARRGPATAKRLIRRGQRRHAEAVA